MNHRTQSHTARSSASLALALTGALLLATLSPADRAHAQDDDAPAPSPAPADAPADAAAAPAPAAPGNAVQLKARVIAFKGSVQVRASEDADWQAVEQGMLIDQGYEIRTNFRSSVQINLIPNDPAEPEHKIVIDRLGVVKLLNAIEVDGKITTDLGMKYGRASYKVEAGGSEHESRIHAPGSTLALRSTDGVLQWDALFGPYVIVNESPNSEFRHTMRNLTIPLSTGILTEFDSGPARHSLSVTVVNPVRTFGASTPADDEQVDRLPGFGDTPGIPSSGLFDLAQQGSGSALGPMFEQHHRFVPDIDAGALFLNLYLFDPSPDGDIVNLYFQDAFASEPTLITGSPFQLGSFASGNPFLLNLEPGINTFTVENANSGSGDLTNNATVLIESGPNAGQFFDFTTFETGEQASISIRGTNTGEIPSQPQ